MTTTKLKKSHKDFIRQELQGRIKKIEAGRLEPCWNPAFRALQKKLNELGQLAMCKQQAEQAEKCKYFIDKNKHYEYGLSTSCAQTKEWKNETNNILAISHYRYFVTEWMYYSK